MTTQAELDRDRFLPRAGLIRGWVDLYVTMFRIAILNNIQDRVANYFYMIGMIAEPVIYLVVWSTVAEQQGGSVGGYTPGQFAAYYIVWTLVRNINIVFTPYGWEERIREGQLSSQLLRPLFPIVEDLGYFAGWKPVVILLWLPIAAVLAWIFHPVLSPSPLAVVVFGVAIWGAYLIRSLNQESLGLITFWTTRVGPLFQLYIAAELLLSGRLVPLSLTPDWVQRLADLLPFRWTFGFPIEALVGNLSEAELVRGLAAQVFWIVVGSVLVRVVWRFAIRRYSAVSG
jgi:ABC-2 type transport system permease protein